MSTADQQRFLNMAQDYDLMAPELVPMYGWLQEEMLRLLEIEKFGTGSIIDLGAGGGIFLEKALSRNQQSTGVWIDSSPAFMEVAKERLAAFSDRVTYIHSPLEEAWEAQLAGQVRAITSMSAIHHLETADKRRLYQRCYDLLAPGGWLVNCDEMKTISPDAYLQSLHFWVRHVDDAKHRIRDEQLTMYDNWAGHFGRWKTRNIDNINEQKQKGDDLHDPFLDQVEWLREIGFAGADVFVKYHLWCVVGGRKGTVQTCPTGRTGRTGRR